MRSYDKKTAFINNYKKLPARLIVLLKENNLTAKSLANKSTIAGYPLCESKLSRIINMDVATENAKTYVFGLDALVALSKTLNVTTDFLLGLSDSRFFDKQNLGFDLGLNDTSITFLKKLSDTAKEDNRDSLRKLKVINFLIGKCSETPANDKNDFCKLLYAILFGDFKLNSVVHDLMVSIEGVDIVNDLFSMENIRIAMINEVNELLLKWSSPAH